MNADPRLQMNVCSLSMRTVILTFSGFPQANRGLHVGAVPSRHSAQRELWLLGTFESTTGLLKLTYEEPSESCPAALRFSGSRWFVFIGGNLLDACRTAVFYVANLDDSRPWVFGRLWSLSIEEQFYLLWPFVLSKVEIGR